MDNNILRSVIPPLCPEHNVFATPVDADELYHGPGAWSGTVVWICPEKDCDYRVGSHPDYRPLGTMASAELRTLRIKAHTWFDRLWKNDPEMDRRMAYKVLSLALDIPLDQTHIGGFTKEQCEETITLLQEYFDLMNLKNTE